MGQGQGHRSAPTYELVEAVGTGAHGTVWRGRDPRTGAAVAIKRVTASAAASEAMEREVAALAQIRHANIVPLLAVIHPPDGSDGAVAVVTSWIAGGSLAQRIDGEAWPIAAVADTLAPIADALAHCHERGVVHGDVSPDNIWFRPDGTPILGDFGAAWHEGATAGRVFGRDAYAAPEVLRGEPPGPAADVYALAVVCAELLEGQPARVGIADHAAPEPLVAVLRQAWHADPTHRPDAASLAQAFRSATTAPAAAGNAAVPSTSTAAPRMAAMQTQTQEFGPRAPEPGEQGDAPRPPRWPVFAGASALVLLVVLGWGQLAARSPRPTIDAGPVTSAANAACPAMPAIVAPPGARRLDVDVQGDGCTVPVVVADHVATGAGNASTLIYVRRTPTEPLQTLAVGEAGDEVLFGRWNCARPGSPAVYRPSTGEVYYFGSIGPDAVTGVPGPADGPHPTGVVRGHPHVVRDPRGCDIVQADPA